MKTTFLQTAAIAFAMCFLLTDCGQKQQKASGNGDSVTAMDSDSAVISSAVADTVSVEDKDTSTTKNLGIKEAIKEFKKRHEAESKDSGE